MGARVAYDQSFVRTLRCNGRLRRPKAIWSEPSAVDRGDNAFGQADPRMLFDRVPNLHSPR